VRRRIGFTILSLTVALIAVLIPLLSWAMWSVGCSRVRSAPP